MATIGVSIESGALHAVLFDPADGEVVATQTTAVGAGESSVLASAIERMQVLAASRTVDVEAIGVVYRTDDERVEFESVIAERGLAGISMFSASSSFLGWLATSNDFADAAAVLLYYMGVGGVSISLADAESSTLSQPKTMTLDSISPERIGSTIPLAWEVVDEAGVKPNSVALFGDPTSNRDLIDILELGLGVPVVRVGEPDLIAARGAALLAHTEPGDRTELVDGSAPVDAAPALLVGAAEPYERPTTAMASGIVSEPVADAVPAAPVTSPVATGGGVAHRRKLVFAAALLVGLLSGGVALAATLPGQDRGTTAGGSDPTSVGADLLGATADALPSEEAGADAAPPTPAAVVPDTRPAAEVPAPEPAPAPAVEPPAWDPTTQQVVAPQTTQPTVAVPPPAPAPAPAPTTVDPPQFTIPVVIPEPGKSEAQLEQEAWDRHWAHTGQWLEQELHGN